MANKPLRIGIDVDSTLNTLELAWSKWIGEMKGDPTFDKHQMVHWNVHETSGLGHRVYDFLKIDGMFEGLGVQPGAQEVVRRLAAAGHELYAVSSIISHDYVEKRRWLARHFPGDAGGRRGLGAFKYLIACEQKGELLRGLDVLVDDALHNHVGFTGKSILFDQPWNQATLRNAEAVMKLTTSGNAYHRASGWDGVGIELGVITSPLDMISVSVMAA